MDVTIVSRGNIKPSSQSITQHLNPHKLCLRDQIIPLTYATCILFYPNTTLHRNDSKTLSHLKKSLSDTLNLYYPFSGRLKDDMISVEDFDSGVPFFEAFVNCPMSVYFHKFDNNELINKLLPYPAFRKEINRPIPIPLLAFQANIFSCGGIAIGTSFCHKIADAASMVYLFSSWAALYRGSPNEATKPNFSYAATLFPPSPDFYDKYSLLVDRKWFREGNYVTRRFFFNAEAVETLREKATIISEQVHSKPTRHEAVTCFIWKHLTEAYWAVSGSRKAISVAYQVVSMRRYLKFQNPIGNLIGFITAVANAEDSNLGSIELPELVKKLKEGMKEYESEIRIIMEEGYGSKLVMRKFEKVFSVVERSDTKTVEFFFSNWKGFFNEVDFGWGKPYKVGVMGDVGPASVNGVFLIDSQDGVGIETTVGLEEKLMAVLERDLKFLDFASLDQVDSSI